MHIALLCIVLLCIDLELFVMIDCPDCEPYDCEECFSGNNNQGKYHFMVSLSILYKFCDRECKCGCSG
jgi:hypothetical protein